MKEPIFQPQSLWIGLMHGESYACIGGPKDGEKIKFEGRMQITVMVSKEDMSVKPGQWRCNSCGPRAFETETYELTPINRQHPKGWRRDFVWRHQSVSPQDKRVLG
jgi:hypothetical protein